VVHARLWDQMEAEHRILLNEFPEDWAHYTLAFPVARYTHLSTDEIIEEMDACTRDFYSLPRIVRRVGRDLWERRQPLRSLVSNLAYRNNARLNCMAHADFKREQGNRRDGGASQM
jgi:hypothetical protein